MRIKWARYLQPDVFIARPCDTRVLPTVDSFEKLGITLYGTIFAAVIPGEVYPDTRHSKKKNICIDINTTSSLPQNTQHASPAQIYSSEKTSSASH